MAGRIVGAADATVEFKTKKKAEKYQGSGDSDDSATNGIGMT